MFFLDFNRADWYKPWTGPTASYVEVGLVSEMMWDDREQPSYGRTKMMNLGLVGNKAVTVVLGKKSGRHSILLKA